MSQGKLNNLSFFFIIIIIIIIIIWSLQPGNEV